MFDPDGLLMWLFPSRSLRAPQFLLPPAAGLLHRLLHLHPASVPGSEERRTHAHRPQSIDHSAGFTGLLCALQLHPLGQVDSAEPEKGSVSKAHTDGPLLDISNIL